MQKSAVVQDQKQIKTYETLETEIKNHLIKKLEMGKMTIKEVAEVSYLLGQAKTVQGLQFLIDNLRKDFDVLDEMEDEKESEADVEVDQIVQKFVSDLIKTDPMKAAEVGTKASEEGVTLEQLIQEYPDLQNYI